MTHSDTPEPEKRLTGPQTQAALLLASGETAVNAAKQVKVSRETMERWKKLPAFHAAVREEEDALYAESLRLLKKLAKSAVLTLASCMDGKVSPYVRVAASSKIIDAGLEIHKIGKLEAEVEQLKGLLAQREFDEA